MQKIISYLDENSSDDARFGPGHDQIQKDYKLLFEKVIDLEWLGLVVKPKKPSTLKRRLEEKYLN